MMKFPPIAFALAALLPCLLINPAGSEGLSLNARIDKAFADEELKGLHSVIVYQKGKIKAELYYKGLDERWGTAIGQRQFQRDSLHDLRSVTKSITSLLYGIALGEGLVPEPSASLYAAFPAYKDLAKTEQHKKITIEHALTMQMGMEWNENLPYTDPRNSEIAMEFAKDRYRYVLSQPIKEEPGKNWIYSGGATALIGKIIANGTGKPLDVYAREKLFAPLGISDFEWVKGADGEPSAASGLRLTARDLAKIGLMLNNSGQWEGNQIIPQKWIKASFTPKTRTPSGLRYGYFWYLGPQGNPPHWAAGFGNGGQRITISKGLDAVIVIMAGNYNKPDGWKMPVRLVEKYILPEILPK